MVEESEAKNFSVKKLTIGKGISIENSGQWSRYYYEVQLDISSEDSIHPAEQHASSIIEEYLREYELAAAEVRPINGAIGGSLDPEVIVWSESKGKSGPFARSVDRENPMFRRLVELLKRNKRTWVHKGLFYWLFPDDKTLGRKPVKANKSIDRPDSART